MPNSLARIVRAYHFAATAHIDQRRKGARAEPYVNHVIEVALLLSDATGGSDPDLIVAGILHDVVEDTDVTSAEIASEFGAEVAALVAEVTDDKTLAKSERKRRQVASAPTKSDRAKMIKIADKTSNLRSLAASPPADWPIARRQSYFAWAEAVVDGCRGVNPRLEAAFDAARATQPGV